MNATPLRALIFVLSDENRQDVVEAIEELGAQGITVTSTTCMPQTAVPNTLYLTDQSAYYTEMTAAGIPTIGYLHDGNAGEQFPHCPYLISEPQWVDADSYQKIYERLTGQPWTILTTDRLVIREMTVDDLDALYALYDEEACRYMTPLDADHDVERARLRDYIDQVYGLFGYGYWALVRKDDGQLIGRMGFATKDNTFGYIIHKDCRRQGYALEAARAILPYARDILQLPEIKAEVHTDNIPSIKFLESLGFRKVEENIYQL